MWNMSVLRRLCRPPRASDGNAFDRSAGEAADRSPQTLPISNNHAAVSAHAAYVTLPRDTGAPMLAGRPDVGVSFFAALLHGCLRARRAGSRRPVRIWPGGPGPE